MSAATIYNQAATNTQTATGGSGVLVVGSYVELSIDCKVTALSGTSPTVQFFVDRIDANGIPFPLWNSSTISVANTPVSQSIGAGLALNVAFGNSIQFRWTITGTLPIITYSSSIIGK